MFALNKKELNMEYKDYYKILGVSRGANQDDIKRAYRKLARKYHPDVSKEKQAEEQFKGIGEAYEVLKDPKKRAAYDQLGNNWRAGEEFRPPPGWNTGGGGFTGTHVNFSDFFESLFAGRPTSGHQCRSPFQAQAKGEDQHAKIAITLEEAYQGTTRTLQLRVPEIDPHRQIHSKTRTLNVKIPQGVVSGQKIRLRSQGPEGVGGVRGDLYLEIEFQPHRFYRVESQDVYLTLPIAPWEAALGSTVAVPTLGGNVDMKIPAGSQSEQKLRLKGRGLQGNPPGDHYIVLQIVTPKASTEAAQAFYRKMAQELSFNPRENLMA